MTFTPKPEETHGQRTLREYQSYGSILGGALGAIAGIVVSGPHFSEWSVVTSSGVILACCGGCAFIGYLAPTLALGSQAGCGSGSSGGFGTSADGDCSGGGSGCGDSGGCGGDGGGGD